VLADTNFLSASTTMFGMQLTLGCRCMLLLLACSPSSVPTP
jgi:hypothetical protein